jgi:hypothetical protein
MIGDVMRDVYNSVPDRGKGQREFRGLQKRIFIPNMAIRRRQNTTALL